jgi:hypothetical protein
VRHAFVELDDQGAHASEYAEVEIAVRLDLLHSLSTLIFDHDAFELVAIRRHRSEAGFEGDFAIAT